MKTPQYPLRLIKGRRAYWLKDANTETVLAFKKEDVLVEEMEMLASIIEKANAHESIMWEDGTRTTRILFTPSHE